MSASSSTLSQAALSRAAKTPEGKVIGPAAHGIFDYGGAAFFLLMALGTRRSNRRAATAALGAGWLLLARAALTDYRWGLKPIFPFAVHGEIDAAFASLAWTVPKLCGFQGTPAAGIFEAYSVLEAAVVRLTDFDSGRAHGREVQARNTEAA